MLNSQVHLLSFGLLLLLVLFLAMDDQQMAQAAPQAYADPMTRGTILSNLVWGRRR